MLNYNIQGWWLPMTTLFNCYVVICLSVNRFSYFVHIEFIFKKNSHALVIGINNSPYTTTCDNIFKMSEKIVWRLYSIVFEYIGKHCDNG